MEIMLINTMIKAVKTTEECHRSSQNKGIVYMLFILTIFTTVLKGKCFGCRGASSTCAEF